MDDPMLDPNADQTRAARLARWFQPSPPELAGLALLVLGAVVASALLWFQAAQRPSELGSDAASAGAAVHADGTTDGPAPGITDAFEPALPEGAPEETGHEASAEVAADVEATVHVTGAVSRPGLVVLPGGSRVGDAVAAAGGLAGDAREDRINLARPLVDGEHVHVPREGEDPRPPEVVPGGGPDGAVSADGTVDINRAGVAELETLPGVGPARAEAIVAHREQHGPFAVPGDLRAVSGIGEVIFQRLAELVTVG